jgi:hypothetical protein
MAFRSLYVVAKSSDKYPTPMTEAPELYEQFVIIHNTTRCHNPKGQSLNLHRLGRLTFHTLRNTGTSGNSFWLKKNLSIGVNDPIWFAVTPAILSILAPAGIKSLFATTTPHIYAENFLRPQDMSNVTQFSVVLLYA